eukprot:gb/GECG01011538.1/.p1 GENE.gb/GECG01011538.1/~~gb/GECG01011538.1/.p1  ORF type:complete len:503 (+),score=61.11 gb/GECG01011538.1/:1-1509(+)
MERPPIVLDNGGYKLRAGFAGLREPACDMVNATAHVEKQINTLIGDDIETHVNDKSQLRYTRPIQRGYITDFDTQKTLWERVFSEEVLDIHPQEHALLCTQPYFNASTITKYLCEMVFEQFGFQSFAMANSEPLMFLEHLGTSASEYIEEIKNQQERNVRGASHQDTDGHGIQFGQVDVNEIRKITPAAAAIQLPPAFHCGLVVNSGFSFTHAVPILHGSPYAAGIKRVDVGGKYLTNYLKDIVSYRQWNIQDAFDEANRIKEQLCYVSRNFSSVWPLAHRLASSDTLTSLEKSYYRYCPGAEKRKGKASRYESTAWAHALVQQDMKKEIGDDIPHTWKETDLAHKELPPETKQYISAAKEIFDDDQVDSSSGGIGFGLRREYVLPDHLNFHKGYAKGSDHDPYRQTRLQHCEEQHEDNQHTEEQQEEEPDTNQTVAVINCERIAVPEVLFSPAFTGLHQGGLVDAVERSISACPAEYQPLLWNNIILAGGNMQFRGIHERL